MKHFGRIKVRRITLIILLCLALTMASFLVSNDIKKSGFKTQKHRIELLKLNKPQKFISSSKCLVPRLEPFSNNMMRHFKRIKPYVCSNETSWVIEKKGLLFLNSHADSEFVECKIKFVNRISDTKNSFKENLLTKNKPIVLESEFYKVDCEDKNSSKKYNNIEASIKKIELEPKKSRSCRNKSGTGLNVIIIGFDSLSHMTYIRLLNKTYSYFVNTLKGKTLNHYNIIGDGTGHALTPILTGTEETHLPSALKTKPNTVHLNEWPFVWNRFKQEGYITMYNEDQPDIGTYTYRLNGFKEPPTDHYMRPFFVSAVKEFKNHKPYCLGSKRRTQVFLDYFKEFQTKYTDECTFSFLFHSEVSHDDTSKIATADDDIFATLKFLNDNNHLNKSVLFLMSDHGARFSSIRQTLQGKLEERLPFFGIHFPKWFEEKYPHLANNFHKNTEKLLTPFDIHATLEDILFLNISKFASVNKYGISILREVPENRTCKDAHIGSHWCTCSRLQEISKNSSIAKNISTVLLKSMNEIIKDHFDLCSNLNLDEIVSVSVQTPEEDLIRFKNTVNHGVYDMTGKTEKDVSAFQVTIKTNPGGGLFEASVVKTSHGQYSIKDEISRINKYGKAAHCVEQKFPDLRKFCYCKNNMS